MKIIFNGTAAEIADGTTLNAFLEERKIQRKNAIVELNEDVVSVKEEISGRILKDGDVLNLYSVVAGG